MRCMDMSLGRDGLGCMDMRRCMDMSCGRRAEGRRMYEVYALVLAVLCAVMYAATPFCDDDLWFTKDSTGAYGSWEYFRTTVATAFAHWQWDVGRFCNMMAAPFIGFFPKWVYGVVTGAWIYLLYVLGIRIAKVRYVSLNAAFWVAVISFFIPWYDSFFTVIYANNYIWGAGLGLTVTYLFLGADEEKHCSGLRGVGLFVLSVCTGWWHEGMSAPLICGLIAYKAAEGRKPTREQGIILGGLAVGIAILLAMPAFRAQTAKREPQWRKEVLWETLMQLSSYCLGYLYVILLGIALCCRTLRRKVFNSRRAWARQAAAFTFTAISFVIFFRYYNGPRTGMFGQLAAGLAIMGLTRHWVKKTRTVLGVTVLTVVTLMAAVSLGMAIKIQLQLTREIMDVRSMAAKEEARSGRPTVFYDPTPIRLGIDLLKPTYRVLNTDYGARGIRIFPSELKDFRLTAPEIKMSSDSSLIIYRNRLLMRGAEPEERVKVVLVYEDGSEELSRTRVRDFITENGDTVSFVFPHTQALGSKRAIKDARLVK